MSLLLIFYIQSSSYPFNQIINIISRSRSRLTLKLLTLTIEKTFVYITSKELKLRIFKVCNNDTDHFPIENGFFLFLKHLFLLQKFILRYHIITWKDKRKYRNIFWSYISLPTIKLIKHWPNCNVECANLSELRSRLSVDEWTNEWMPKRSEVPTKKCCSHPTLYFIWLALLDFAHI